MDSFVFGFMFAFGVAVFLVVAAIVLFVAYMIVAGIYTFLSWLVRKIVMACRK